MFQSPPADATTVATASCLDNSISTPADIFKHYAQHHKSPAETKSILKAPSSRTQQSTSDVGQNTESRASGDAPQFQRSSTVSLYLFICIFALLSIEHSIIEPASCIGEAGHSVVTIVLRYTLLHFYLIYCTRKVYLFRRIFSGVT